MSGVNFNNTSLKALVSGNGEGTSGQVLTSAGAGAHPTFESVAIPNQLTDGTNFLTLIELDGNDVDLTFQNDTAFVFDQDVSSNGNPNFGDVQASELQTVVLLFSNIQTSGPGQINNVSSVFFATAGGAFTLETPDNSGQVMIIKDSSGVAATTNIVITPDAGTVDGAATVTISANYGVLKLIWDGSNWYTL